MLRIIQRDAAPSLPQRQRRRQTCRTSSQNRNIHSAHQTSILLMQVRRCVGTECFVIRLSLTCMHRIVEEEWLDQGDGTVQEIVASHRSIAIVNRRYGGDRLHARLLARAFTRVPAGKQARILEVASGQAEVLRRAIQQLSVSAEVTLLDRDARHLPDPQTWPKKLPPPQIIVGNALQIPCPDASVDIVSCCLFLHHLEPPEAMRFLAEAQRVARVAVIINDLERSRVHHWLAQLYGLFDPSRLSAHDGPVSVRRAYTYRELAMMLARTGKNFSLERAYLFRLGALLWC
jgi:ubiquinone/menaquinone biosynthesis C-methylase UbiE